MEDLIRADSSEAGFPKKSSEAVAPPSGAVRLDTPKLTSPQVFDNLSGGV